MGIEQQFDDLLTKSVHFGDTMNAQREAVAQIVAAFIEVLVISDKMSLQQAIDTLAKLERHDGKNDGPSITVSRRNLVGLIRDSMQRKAPSGRSRPLKPR
jgi:hypothetical protein